MRGYNDRSSKTGPGAATICCGTDHLDIGQLGVVTAARAEGKLCVRGLEDFLSRPFPFRRLVSHVL